MPAPLLNVPHSQQQAEFACVPACVKMVLAFYGVEVSEEDLTRLMETDWEGTIPDHITRVSSFGMLATVYHAEMSDVQRYLESGVPCIAFVSTVYFNYYNAERTGPHAVVVVGMDTENVYVHDPLQLQAPNVISREEFRLAWAEGRNGIAVIMPLPQMKSDG